MIKNTILCLLTIALCVSTLNAQDFYSLDSIPEVKLTFFQTNWDAKLDSLKNANEDAFPAVRATPIWCIPPPTATVI